MAEEILIKLATIASLEKGQTLSVIYEVPVFHNSWGTSISRTYNGEHRKKTMSYIKNVFEQALIIASELDQDPDGYKILVDQIKAALEGIESLKFTYKSDYYTIGLINTIVEETNKYLEEIKPCPGPCVKIEDQKCKIEKYETLDQELFFEAIKTNDYATIEEYLYEGSNPNIKNNFLQNGLHCIADTKYYQEKILNILINFNVDPLAKDVDGNRPLYYAISSGNIQCIIRLEEYISKKKREQ